MYPDIHFHPLTFIIADPPSHTDLSSAGPLLFVAWPLILGLFISSWAHKQIRTNRSWYDKITLPTNVPPYDDLRH